MQAIAKILYEDTPTEQLQTLEGIETAVRTHLLEQVGSKLTLLFIESRTGTSKGRKRRLKSCVGNFQISLRQAQILKVKKQTQLSPLLEKCCLVLSIALQLPS